MRKVILLLLCLFLFLFLFLYPNPYPSPAFAQNCSSSYSSRVQEGLISSPQISAGSKLGTTSGACITDPKAAFAPYKIPSFDDLRSLYYDQAKPSTSITKTDRIGDKNGQPFDQGDIPMTTGSDHLYFIKKTTPTSSDGNLNISSNISGNQTGVVFVERDLNITSQISDGTPNGTANWGLVFVVKGNVNISQDVTRIDAIIISEGIICTAYNASSSNCLDGTTVTPQLIINGSLISIDQIDQCPPTGSNCPIKFRRNLNNNSIPAEKINHQVKYLVILRNLFSDTFQRWSEIQ